MGTRQENRGLPVLLQSAILLIHHLFFTPPAAATSVFDVTQWTLRVAGNNSGVENLGAFFTTVINPFSDAHAISMNSVPATSNASYAHSWNDQNGSFHVSASQTAGGNPNLGVSASGTIRIRPNTPLLMHVDATYQYALAGGDREAELLVDIRLFPQGGSVWAYNDLAMPIVGDPPTGIFGVNELVSLPTLPDGSEYRLIYLFALRSYSGSPSAISTGTGGVTFTIIPEPATISLFAPAMLLLARRRTDRR